MLYAVLGAGALGELSQVWSEISAASGAAGRIAELLAVRAQITAPAQPAKLPRPLGGEIVFDHVAFAYPVAGQSSALHDLSLRIAPGERVAIVGPSGAGKTTLFQLLMRFYDPQQGRILIDGVDIKTLVPAELRRNINSVPQDPVIFAGSVAENIRYGQPEAGDAAVEEAARRAAALDFIRALPDGFAAGIGERGVTLSGGQKQRLAYRPRHPAGSADPAARRSDVGARCGERNAGSPRARSLDDRGRTTLVIAHRLATVLSADRILVMDNGRIVEEGTHATLVVKEGLYARLARLQFETGAAALKDSRSAAE